MSVYKTEDALHPQGDHLVNRTQRFISTGCQTNTTKRLQLQTNTGSFLRKEQHSIALLGTQRTGFIVSNLLLSTSPFYSPRNTCLLLSPALIVPPHTQSLQFSHNENYYLGNFPSNKFFCLQNTSPNTPESHHSPTAKDSMT